MELTAAMVVAFADECQKLAGPPVPKAVTGALVPRNPIGSMGGGKFKAPTGTVASPPVTPRLTAPGPTTSAVTKAPGTVSSTVPAPAPAKA